jgi:hypothetical protein
MKNWSIAVLKCWSDDRAGARLVIVARLSINPSIHQSINPLLITPPLHHSNPARLHYSIS